MYARTASKEPDVTAATSNDGIGCDEQVAHSPTGPGPEGLTVEPVPESLGRDTSGITMGRQQRDQLPHPAGEVAGTGHHRNQGRADQPVDVGSPVSVIGQNGDVGQEVVEPTTTDAGNHDPIRVSIHGQIESQFEIGLILVSRVGPDLGPLAPGPIERTLGCGVEIANNDVGPEPERVDMVDS